MNFFCASATRYRYPSSSVFYVIDESASPVTFKQTPHAHMQAHREPRVRLPPPHRLTPRPYPIHPSPPSKTAKIAGDPESSALQGYRVLGKMRDGRTWLRLRVSCMHSRWGPVRVGGTGRGVVVWYGVGRFRDVERKLGDRRRRWLRGALGSWEDDARMTGWTTLCGRLVLARPCEYRHCDRERLLIRRQKFVLSFLRDSITYLLHNSARIVQVDPRKVVRELCWTVTSYAKWISRYIRHIKWPHKKYRTIISKHRQLHFPSI
jgi:hypothetical protein